MIRTRKTVAALMLAAGMLAGCGGVGAVADEPSNFATRRDELPYCGSTSYMRIYYSDPGFTNEVGEMDCVCYSTAYVYGNWHTSYFQDYNFTYCAQPNPR